ncbi:MAG: CDP-alcohol phosphatidyltransferase family protein [Anaerolineae bacterium]|nr:CDP-alcohol phosphatidyltransferase family protein [Anaerolineae bacterium]
MFTDWLRKTFRGVLEPIARFLAKTGIGPNTLTILGCLFNIGVGVIIATGHLRLGGVCLICASAFDAFDGTLARQLGKASKFGAFLDSVLDRFSESALLLGIAWWYMTQPGTTEEILAYFAIVGSILVSYTRARAEGLGVECKIGLFTRVERCLVLIVALIFNLVPQALWVLAIGSFFTAFQRIFYVYRHTKGALLQE